MTAGPPLRTGEVFFFAGLRNSKRSETTFRHEPMYREGDAEQRYVEVIGVSITGNLQLLQHTSLGPDDPWKTSITSLPYSEAKTLIDDEVWIASTLPAGITSPKEDHT